MIEANGLTKYFDDIAALKGMTTRIPAGSIYGLVGSNGAGKSTFLRLLAGVYRPDEGAIAVDGAETYENPAVKDRIFFLADELYFFQNATMDQMARFYSGLYGSWSQERYRQMCVTFPIHAERKINTFSKGMQRQAAIILALSAQPDILLLDEAFDGLDPVIRGLVRKILAEDVAQRGATVIIASHNLRELEDLCDQVGVLHGGRILFQRDIDDLKLGFFKVQCAFRPAKEREDFAGLDLLQFESRGSLINLIARGAREEILGKIEAMGPLFVETVPLTLEEVFIHEMEAVGYDYSNILF
ncbi:ABC transporter ATP-binding protein [Clostridiaceae bacterium NSJ-31]|uniref:ABC transporter ATP-binding protein n=1 Tax=Ligaoa zhengdingensis TaxID=2763658 RepID=A0A926E043_9FIRM|nr:ABC transporter ATP-binding protein [Ligaoa zhengdingensis]MBC8546629.1 ABC transporter ATP-binding protein [Ligaoa zhengdingensis]